MSSDGEALLRRDRARRAAGIQADDDVHAAVLEVERVGVALGAEADDRAGLGGEEFEVGVFIGVNFGGHRKRRRKDGRLRVEKDVEKTGE